MKSFFKGKSGFFAWQVFFSTAVGTLIAFEAVRLIARFRIASLYRTDMTTENIVVIAVLVAIIAFTWLNQKRAPFFLSFVILYNFFNIGIIPIGSKTDVRITASEMIGMPEFLFYVYVGIQAVLVIGMVSYYFSDYLFGDDCRPKSERRALAFGDYLKNLEAERQKNENESDIWRD